MHASVTRLIKLKELSPSLRIITLDATGTLLKFHKPPFQIYSDFGMKYGLRVDKEEIKKSFESQWKLLTKTQPHFGLCWRSWWTNFVIGTFKECASMSSKDHEKLPALAAELIEHFRTERCWGLKPGAVELLSKLDGMKKSSKLSGIGVISNFDPRLREILGALGILDKFDFLLISHEIQKSKPEIFKDALKISKFSSLQPSECLHIGDNYELDYLGARNAGWNGALILSEKERGDSRSPVENVLIYSSLDEINKEL